MELAKDELDTTLVVSLWGRPQKPESVRGLELACGEGADMYFMESHGGK
jgi:hypothetical protein